MNGQINLLFWVFGVMVALLLLSGMISGWMMLKLDLQRLDPQHGAVGEPLIIHYAIHNRGRFLPGFNLHVEEIPGGDEANWPALMAPALGWVMHVGTGETVHGEAVFWPARRGEARFDRVRLWSTFPFGIIKKSITLSQPLHTLVYPQLHEIRGDVLNALRPEGIMGMKVTQNPGAGDDYFGMREYRPGDSMRHIAWRRSAASDALLVIERTVPSPPKLRVVLNLATPPEELELDPSDGLTAEDLEERAISLAASLLHAGDAEGFDVGLTVWGLDVPPIPLRRSHWHHAKIMATLAGLDLTQSRRAPEAHPIPDAERAGQVIVHPDRVRGLEGRSDAWHFTARQMDSLAVRPIGWGEAARGKGPAASTTSAGEEAA